MCRQELAARKIQACYRGSKARRSYVGYRKSVVALQCCWRRKVIYIPPHTSSFLPAHLMASEISGSSICTYNSSQSSESQARKQRSQSFYCSHR